MNITNIIKAYELFVSDTYALENAVSWSTMASWGGQWYVLELLDDCTYHVLWSCSIGNLYDSPGVMIKIPTLSDDEWSGDENERYYDNAIVELDILFNEKINELLNDDDNTTL